MATRTNATAAIRRTLDRESMQAWHERSTGVYPVSVTHPSWRHELALAITMVKANWITHAIKGYVSVY